jgi:hypothetical protein
MEGTFSDLLQPQRRNTAQQTEDKREKIQALSLVKECSSMKLDLLTNATVVDDAIRFVSQKSKDKVESTDSGNEDNKESSEPGYDEDKDQLWLEAHSGLSHSFATTTSTIGATTSSLNTKRLLLQVLLVKDDIKENPEATRRWLWHPNW